MREKETKREVLVISMYVCMPEFVSFRSIKWHRKIKVWSKGEKVTIQTHYFRRNVSFRENGPYLCNICTRVCVAAGPKKTKTTTTTTPATFPSNIPSTVYYIQAHFSATCSSVPTAANGSPRPSRKAGWWSGSCDTEAFSVSGE